MTDSDRDRFLKSIAALSKETVESALTAGGVLEVLTTATSADVTITAFRRGDGPRIWRVSWMGLSWEHECLDLAAAQALLTVWGQP